MKVHSDCAYLEGGGPDGLGPAVRLLAVFQCGDALRGRAVYGVYMPITGRCGYRRRACSLGPIYTYSAHAQNHQE